MNVPPQESTTALADALRTLAFHIETRGAIEDDLREEALNLLRQLRSRGFDVPLEQFAAAPGSFAPSIVVGFIRRYAERIEYSEEEKTQAAARAEPTIARWIHRFEQVLDIPRGHILAVAREPVPACAFADFVLRLEQRIGASSPPAGETAEAWTALRQGIPELEAAAAVGPADVLRRGLACSLIVRRLRLYDGVTPLVVPFRDVDPTHPSFRDIALMRHLGVVSGWYTDNLFRPERALTYFELAKIIANVFRVKMLGEKSPARLFFSHSGKDKDFVRRLKAQLETRGVHSWMDEEQVTPGEHVRRAIADSINNPDVVVVAVISKNAMSSEWVRYELDLALAAPPGKRPKLVPVKIDDVEMPEALADIACVPVNMPYATDVEGAADLERACEAILTVVEDVDLRAALERIGRS